MNKKMKVIFTVSVLLNVFLLGLLIGGASKEFNHEKRVKNRMQQELSQFTDMLPDNQKQAFVADFKALADDNEEIRQRIRGLRKDIATIFATEPFDEQQFYLKTQEMHDLRGQQMQQSSRLIGQMASQLTLEQREKLNLKLAMGKRRLIKRFDMERRPPPMGPPAMME